MERLTEKIDDEKYIAVQERVNGKIIGNQMCLNRLAEYENIGLTPEEIIKEIEAKKCLSEFCEQYKRHIKKYEDAAEQRQQGCEYCKHGKEFIKSKIIHVAYPKDFELQTNFCPMCGRKLN